MLLYFEFPSVQRDQVNPYDHAGLGRGLKPDVSRIIPKIDSRVPELLTLLAFVIWPQYPMRCTSNKGQIWYTSLPTSRLAGKFPGSGPYRQACSHLQSDSLQG